VLQSPIPAFTLERSTPDAADRTPPRGAPTRDRSSDVMGYGRNPLDPFFEPASVAVFGNDSATQSIVVYAAAVRRWPVPDANVTQEGSPR
jgi:hypothetical protein